jgi:hypothetical protein
VIPRLPRPLARRIDRLARSAHAFHRFAHHPLCERYASEVIPLGRRARICRGCTLAVLGAAAGAAGGWLLGPPAWLGWVALTSALALLASARRWPKSLSRGLPLALLAFGATASLACGLASATALSGFVAWYRQRGPNRSPCAACPERSARVCSGLAPMVLRERAFRRLTGRWIEAGGVTFAPKNGGATRTQYG